MVEQKDHSMTKTLIGLFDDFTAALNTVPDLLGVGIPRENVSVITHDIKGEFSDFQPAEESSRVVTGAGTGATLGGVGGLLIGLGTLAIPGAGPLVAAGPLAATLAGAALGAATGSLIGAFKTLGISKDEAHYYAEGVRRGGTVLTVTVTGQMVDTATQI